VTLLAEAMELTGYTLLGHSFGVSIALQHAVDHPGRAARIVCSGGIAYRDALAHTDETFESFGTPELGASVEAAFEAEERVETPEDCHAVWMGEMPFFLSDPRARRSRTSTVTGATSATARTSTATASSATTTSGPRCPA
jgi:pimeloyl-ACP methyl ester carboxylesterase